MKDANTTSDSVLEASHDRKIAALNEFQEVRVGLLHVEKCRYLLWVREATHGAPHPVACARSHRDRAQQSYPRSDRLTWATDLFQEAAV